MCTTSPNKLYFYVVLITDTKRFINVVKTDVCKADGVYFLDVDSKFLNTSTVIVLTSQQKRH